jgi:hypothetical protein
MAKKKEEVTVKTLKKEIDAITFNNKQARDIRLMQEGKQRLKDKMGRNKERRVSFAGRIKGLQTL